MSQASNKRIASLIKQADVLYIQLKKSMDFDFKTNEINGTDKGLSRQTETLRDELKNVVALLKKEEATPMIDRQ